MGSRAGVEIVIGGIPLTINGIYHDADPTTGYVGQFELDEILMYVEDKPIQVTDMLLTVALDGNQFVSDIQQKAFEILTYE